MPDSPAQDRKIGLGRVAYNGRWVTEYDPALAARIVEGVAEGHLLRDLCTEGNGLPAPTTFMRWVMLYPELNKAWNAAVELSARMLEEEALSEARFLRKKPGTQQEVRACEILIQQLRWSAERRDPSKFGAQRQVSIRVPIQINTVLDLGDAEKGERIPNVYELKATVERDETEVPVKPRPLLEGPRYDPKAPRKRVLTPRTKEPDNVG